MLARLYRFGYSLAGWAVVLGLVACQSTPSARATANPRPTVPPSATALPRATSTPRPPAAATQVPIRLAWFYKPPADEAAITQLQTDYDVFILTHLDEPLRDELRAAGVPGPFLQYLRFNAIHDPGSCKAQPNRNQVADQPGDFCRLREEHPEWFLRDAAGDIIVENDYALMDPGQPGWHAFWLARAIVMQETHGWDGVFLDNVEASLSKRERRDGLPAAYATDEAYQAANLAFLAELRANYFAPQGRPLWGNIIEAGEPTVWGRYLYLLDGVMLEAFAVDWSTGYRSAKSWEAQLAMVEEAQVLGKSLVLVAQGRRTDTARQTFALASYLLIAREKTAFRYTHHDHYSAEWWYPNYASALGPPLGARYAVGTAWQRDFANGSVWVDPTTHEAAIVVPEK